MTRSPASELASALLGELVRRGLRDLVVCPGSRSQALALAAARFEQAGLLRLHVRIDERVAGFLALGLAVETGVPAAVVVTSGTAVANLHPAVLEASHAGIPLLVLSADRPEELRGIGSNQTTVQPGIFAGAVRRELDVPAPDDATPIAELAAALAEEALGETTGPVHLNLAFREPLSGAVSLPDLDPGEWAPASPAGETVVLEPGPGTVVVAGAGAGAEAEELAHRLGAPLIAEVASGARFGPNLVVAYRRLLGTANFGDRVERVVVLGHPTLSREVPALIARRGVETIVVTRPGVERYDPGHAVARFADAVEVSDAELPPERARAARAWVGRWVQASRALLERDPAEAGPSSSIGTDYRERAAFAKEQLAHLRAQVSRRDLVEAVWAASWPHDRLVLGASRLIREADMAVPGKKLRVHANRGLAGIDGTVATAMGIALASQDAGEGDAASSRGTTRVLLGDLALLHDVGALLVGEGERSPRIQVIVGNDGGGTIFDGLEVAGSADRAHFDRVMLTPQRVELASLAAAYGWEHRLVATRGDLEQALTATPGRVILEVPLAR
ncbi:2-succinyl-5-enolpyruvyl-6-hydroxy-3-cyclohexene-1-carboxylic-acid synthase [Homoserinibacter sp. YIM 151385]|uniref:2-succinyl-5-enolpyruvyl-6-hydroxy-3- cyclohexene-1-carboxylic-acid synthase n=1 Tax=Homoserinibacter sp. YIM 151385 TaxID=2985506 RepID=UPI0022F03F69|nr:2-succinyl-5-enolpyruvyl-6-hydroxy-3-cyclohexene-1-carboxylic-acid synthase [Homoserinibacter sp. YIM 151385]WBU37000.1 2-succinyl-5-enolpyruvyl-6-hydroxy-3-cyclohexene-1-carboxylic-acid synthase [Homoserinibacter sp. YIM 151385]